MTIRVAALLFAAAVLWPIVPARALSYPVKACDATLAPGVPAVNNSWQVFATAPSTVTEAVAVCPSGTPDPYGDTGQGLAVHDKLGGPNAPADGTYREWRFTTPPGTTLSSYLVNRDFGNRLQVASGAFTIYARAGTALIAGEGCFRIAGPDPFCRVTGTVTNASLGDATELAWGLKCEGNSFCDPGTPVHEVWVALRAATVFVEDSVPPTVSVPTGPLTDNSSWQGGEREVTLEGSDVTGIRQVGVGPALRSALPGAAGGCGEVGVGIAYSFTTPCSGSRGVNGPQTIGVDTREIPDGTSQIRGRAVDTAGNVAESAPFTVRIDNEAQPSPHVTGDGAWSAAAAGTWSVEAPGETDRAPVATMDIEVCVPAGCTTDTIGSPSVVVNRELAEGVSTARARSTDTVGNVSGWSAPVELRRDRTAPAVTVSVPAGPVDAGAAVKSTLTATDGLSGVATTTLEYRVDGGAWQALDGQVAARGKRLRFRGTATDRAGNARVAESGDVAVRAAERPGIVSVTASRKGRVLRVSGRVRPKALPGRVRIKLRKRRILRPSVLTGGRFRATFRSRRPLPARIVVRYAGDRRVVAVRRG